MDHGAFLKVCSRPVLHSAAEAAQDAASRRASRSVSGAAVVGAASAGAAAICALVGAAGPAAAGAAGGLLKLAMIAPVPPPMPLPTVDTARNGDGAPVALPPQQGFLDMLFPNFDPNSFIFRISVLQLLEYIGSLFLGSMGGAPKLCSLYLLGASWGPAIAGGAIWRLFFPMMLHANPLHIFFNLFFQLRIGFGMEKQFGKRKFCLLYLFCGFLGNLLSVVADPMKLAVGASTSGFGLIGVWAAEVMLTWELLGTSRPRVFLWFGFMLLSCIMMSTISPNVDFVGHFGGALAGFLLAIILADMQEEHQPAWYGKAKASARNGTVLLITASLFKAITLGPDGPIPFCGSIFFPRALPF